MQKVINAVLFLCIAAGTVCAGDLKELKSTKDLGEMDKVKVPAVNPKNITKYPEHFNNGTVSNDPIFLWSCELWKRDGARKDGFTGTGETEREARHSAARGCMTTNNPSCDIWSNDPAHTQCRPPHQYDWQGYDRYGFDRNGYNRKGFDRHGYNRYGYDSEGFDRYGYDSEGYARDGYNHQGYDRYGCDRTGYTPQGYDRYGYDRQGYNAYGYDHNGYDRNGYDKNGYDHSGYDRDGYNSAGYDHSGYNRQGFDQYGCDRTGYTPDGYDRYGFNREGWDRQGYGHDGFNRAGWDRDGYNRKGYDKNGYNRKGYDANGYDREGFDEDGYGHDGFNRAGYNREGYNRDGYDQYGFNSNGLNAGGKPCVPQLTVRTNTDCETLSVADIAPDPVRLENFDEITSCCRGKCVKSVGEKHFRTVRLSFDAGRKVYPWELEKFETCLNGNDARVERKSGVYDYKSSLADDGSNAVFNLAPKGQRSPAKTDMDALKVLSFSQKGNSFNLLISDKWGEAYKGEQIKINLALYRNKGGKDSLFKKQDFIVDAAKQYDLTLVSDIKKADFYIIWSFQRLGETTANTTSAEFRTDMIAVQ